MALFDTESLNGRTAVDLFRTPQLLSTEIALTCNRAGRCAHFRGSPASNDQGAAIRTVWPCPDIYALPLVQ